MQKQQSLTTCLERFLGGQREEKEQLGKEVEVYVCSFAGFCCCSVPFYCFVFV
jgi:hypothetical protein